MRAIDESAARSWIRDYAICEGDARNLANDRLAYANARTRNSLLPPELMAQLERLELVTRKVFAGG